MIVEFVGLPGAGKTTLENALVDALARRGVPVMRREEAVSTYITDYVGISRTRSSILRRLSTALYKLRLFLMTMARPSPLLELNSLKRPHLLRAALRLAEDQCLYRWAEQHLQHPTVLDLAEGYSQHSAALLVWRKLLGSRHEEPALTSPRLSVTDGAAQALVVYVDLPQASAQTRLLRRGIPPFWPRHTDPDAVMTAFSRSIGQVVHAVSSIQGMYVLHIDAAKASPGWHAEAELVADRVEACMTSPRIRHQ